MADWTTIPDSSIEPGKPIRSIDGLALRDNPIAIAEGAVGADRIVGRAAKRIIDYPVLTVSASDAFSALNGVTVVAGTTSNSSSSNVVARTATINLYTGSLQFSFSQALSTSFNVQVQSVAEVYKNNVFVQSYSLVTQDNVSSTRTINISIAPNDVIEIRHRMTSNPSFGASSIGALSANGSDGYTTRSLFIAQSEINRA